MSDTEHRRRLLSRKDVERVYGISRRFLEIAAVRGDGPRMTKIGRRATYQPAEIERWIASRTVSSTSEEIGS